MTMFVALLMVLGYFLNVRMHSLYVCALFNLFVSGDVISCHDLSLKT